MEGPSLDVSSASLDIFMMALALSGSLVPGRRWWASSPGPAGELDLALVQNWGTSLIFMQNGSEQLAGLLPLFLCFLLSFTPRSPALSAVISVLLLFRPPVPVPFSSRELPVVYSSLRSLPPWGFLPPHLPGCFPGAAALRVGWLVPISQVHSTRPRFGNTSFVVVLYLEVFLRMSKSLEKGSSTLTGLLPGVKGLQAEQEIYVS